MKYKKSLDEYPEILSGDEIFKYNHDLLETQIEDLNALLDDESTSEVEKEKYKEQLADAEEKLHFTDTMLNLLYGKGKDK